MTGQTSESSNTHPNILLIMVDQLRYPRFGYGEAGLVNPIKEILSFVGDLENNPYAKYFPGFIKLREYGVVLSNHCIAESACIPSRASIMTGQYGPRTGVTQTDGLFKSGDAHNFPWLKHDSFATLGDWFKAAGYTTHYFGKWHVSNPPEHSLKSFGFDDWELSWPEPHGALLNNLGSFRDYQFADLASSFLQARGLGVPYSRAVSQQSEDHPLSQKTPETKPFLAVCSFTNPHDIAAYPTLPRALASTPGFGPGGSVPVPDEGQLSSNPTQGTFEIPLNPDGFPQDCASSSPTQDEDLLSNNKPRAQYDYSVKVGLGLAAKGGLAIAEAASDPSDPDFMKKAVEATMGIAIPFHAQKDPQGAALGFLQYYGYMIYMVDRHILQVLNALESSGLRDNTIVVFASDHGEYGASHSMMMEKWHGAYQEVVHVPVVVSSPQINPEQNSSVVIEGQTSHIDLLPTLLGLADISDDRRKVICKQLSKTHQAMELPGEDLSGLIRKTGDDSYACSVSDLPVLDQRSVLFVTDDMITEPLPKDNDPHNIHSWRQYDVYSHSVEYMRTQSKIPRLQFPDLAPGPVQQPAHVRAVKSGNWKLVRYCDPWSKKPAADEWEMYNLGVDPTEATNLLVYNGAFPTAIPEDEFPTGLNMDQAQVKEQAVVLRKELAKLEADLLKPYPSAHPTAGAAIGE